MEDKWREKAADGSSGGRRLPTEKWREKAADREQWKTCGERRLPIGAVEDKWREKAADKEQWKTSGGRGLPIGRSRRQVEGEGCR